MIILNTLYGWNMMKLNKIISIKLAIFRYIAENRPNLVIRGEAQADYTLFSIMRIMSGGDNE